MAEHDLTVRPNIGSTLSEKLRGIGVTTYDELVDLGSVEVVLRISDQDPTACYNMLYAIEGAIRGVRWFGIPKQDRVALKQEYDLAFRQSSSGTHN